MRILSFVFVVLFFITFVVECNVSAQEMPNEGIETFYRPIKSSDLIVFLPPRSDDRASSLGSFGQSMLFTGGGDCPDEINIGSVSDDTPIFGGIDIELFIDSDIIIMCN